MFWWYPRTTISHQFFNIRMSHNLGGPPGVYPPPPWANSNTNNDNSNRNVGGSEGLDIEVRPDHWEAYDETTSHRIKCIPDYRRRIQKIIAWLKVEYPEHHDKIVFDLTDTQRANTNVYYNATQDIMICSTIMLFNALLVQTKQRQMENITSMITYANITTQSLSGNGEWLLGISIFEKRGVWHNLNICMYIHISVLSVHLCLCVWYMNM